MHRRKTMAGVLLTALILVALTTLTIGAADHTDEGLLNEKQEQIGFIDLESDGAANSLSHAVVQNSERASLTDGVSDSI